MPETIGRWRLRSLWGPRAPRREGLFARPFLACDLVGCKIVLDQDRGPNALRFARPAWSKLATPRTASVLGFDQTGHFVLASRAARLGRFFRMGWLTTHNALPTGAGAPQNSRSSRRDRLCEKRDLAVSKCDRSSPSRAERSSFGSAPRASIGCTWHLATTPALDRPLRSREHATQRRIAESASRAGDRGARLARLFELAPCGDDEQLARASPDTRFASARRLFFEPRFQTHLNCLAGLVVCNARTRARASLRARSTARLRALGWCVRDEHRCRRSAAPCGVRPERARRGAVNSRFKGLRRF